MIRVSSVPLRVKQVPEDFTAFVAELTGWTNIKSVTVVKKSVDARKKTNLHLEYSFDVEINGDEEEALKNSLYRNIAPLQPYPVYRALTSKPLSPRPIVVGTGPAGIMAALALAEAGANPLVIERGKNVSRRRKDVERLWKIGELNENSNVQFGEGGAGTFSDGKLNTGIKKDSLTRKVLTEFIAAGAPPEILYEGKPHIGTDKLGRVVTNIRRKILSLGGEYRFETRLTDIIVKDGAIKAVQVVNAAGEIEEIAATRVILAIGHSARDTFEMLYNRGVKMIQKPFAVGVRIEHLQSFINKSRYGMVKPKALLGAADYKIAVHMDNGRGVYSFCMCPGGTVVAAASEAGRVATNGMSFYARDGVNANSALLVDVKPEEDFETDHPLAGVEFQRKIEENAFRAGGGLFKAPVQKAMDFIEGRETTEFGEVLPTYRPGVSFADMRAVLPPVIAETLRLGFRKLNRKIYEFSKHDALLTGAETRSSSPVRILRDPNCCESVNVSGLYPCGEGAGYAGGIVSAAADGLRCAAHVIVKENT